MSTNRRTEAMEVLKTILQDLDDARISTHTLLMRCQRMAVLLDLPSDESRWIGLELQGYPTQSTGQKPPDQKWAVPPYRCLQLPTRGQMTVSGEGQEFPFAAVHMITEPVGALESCDTSLPVAFSFIHDGRHVMIYSAELSPARAKGIAQAVRSRVNDFITKQQIALALESSITGLFDSLRSSLANRLSQLDQSLLELLHETLAKQERAISPVDLRDVLENLRTIIRRFTSLVLLNDMVPAGQQRPPDSHTGVKTKLTCQWIGKQLRSSYDKETTFAETVLESLERNQSALMGIIEKKGHETRMEDVVKSEVDHVAVFTVLWLADFVRGLDKAGFPWPDGKKGEIVGNESEKA